MKRRLLSMVIAGTMVCSMLTGCGSSGDTGKNGEINIFVSLRSTHFFCGEAYETQNEENGKPQISCSFVCIEEKTCRSGNAERAPF